MLVSFKKIFWLVRSSSMNCLLLYIFNFLFSLLPLFSCYHLYFCHSFLTFSSFFLHFSDKNIFPFSCVPFWLSFSFSLLSFLLSHYFPFFFPTAFLSSFQLIFLSTIFLSSFPLFFLYSFPLLSFLLSRYFIKVSWPIAYCSSEHLFLAFFLEFLLE